MIPSLLIATIICTADSLAFSISAMAACSAQEPRLHSVSTRIAGDIAAALVTADSHAINDLLQLLPGASAHEWAGVPRCSPRNSNVEQSKGDHAAHRRKPDRGGPACDSIG